MWTDVGVIMKRWLGGSRDSFGKFPTRGVTKPGCEGTLAENGYFAIIPRVSMSESEVSSPCHLPVLVRGFPISETSFAPVSRFIMRTGAARGGVPVAVVRTVPWKEAR
jgi:hypothetical protein